MPANIGRLSSRKFIAVMFWEGMFTLLLIVGKLSEESFVAMTMALLVSYLVVNSAQHVWEPKP